MTTPALLGVDGGGTSTVAWLADRDGRVRGRGRAGPSNAKAVGEAAAREALRRAIASAFEDAAAAPGPVEVACFGLAGFSRAVDRATLAGWSGVEGWARRLVAVTDGDLVLAAGTPSGTGLAVIAGTGSIAVGRADDGRTARAGGWGPRIGDEGGAYAVALSALRLVARRADGRSPATADPDPLTCRVCAALGIAGPSELVGAVYAPGVDRTRLAALAPAIVAASEDDPSVVGLVLEPAGRELAEMVAAVGRALGWSGGGVALAMAGGFLLAAPAVAGAMLGRLARSGYDVRASAVEEPVRGALVLARRALEGTLPA